MELKIEQLQKKYGENTVLNIPELTIHSGELVGLVGNNGAGKTTLLRLMLDVIEATQGRVLSGDQNVAASEVWKTYTGSFIDKHFLIDFRRYFLFVPGVVINLIKQVTHLLQM